MAGGRYPNKRFARLVHSFQSATAQVSAYPCRLRRQASTFLIVSLITFDAMNYALATSHWLSAHAAAVQALASVVSVFLAAVLAYTTIFYAREAKLSREAAEKSAKSAGEQLEFIKKQYENQFGLGPQILREKLRQTLELIKYWEKMLGVGAGNPHSVPDPSPLGASELTSAQEYARRISPKMSELVSKGISALRSAKSEFERVRQSVRGPTMSPYALSGDASQYLAAATEAINDALNLLPEESKTP